MAPPRPGAGERAAGTPPSRGVSGAVPRLAPRCSRSARRWRLPRPLRPVPGGLRARFAARPPALPWARSRRWAPPPRSCPWAEMGRGPGQVSTGPGGGGGMARAGSRGAAGPGGVRVRGRRARRELLQGRFPAPLACVSGWVLFCVCLGSCRAERGHVACGAGPCPCPRPFTAGVRTRSGSGTPQKGRARETGWVLRAWRWRYRGGRFGCERGPGLGAARSEALAGARGAGLGPATTNGPGTRSSELPRAERSPPPAQTG